MYIMFDTSFVNPFTSSSDKHLLTVFYCILSFLNVGNPVLMTDMTIALWRLLNSREYGH